MHYPQCNGTGDGSLILTHLDIQGARALYGTPTGDLRGFYGKCLDADANASGANGTRIQLWDCNGWANQKWAIGFQ